MGSLYSGQHYLTAGGQFGIAATASGSANTKGSWAEVFSSTSRNAHLLRIYINRGGTTADRDHLIDIGIGAGGSEQVVVANLLCSFNTPVQGWYLDIPITIPAGSRVAIRTQSSDGGAVVALNFYLLSTGFRNANGLQDSLTYGANTGDSGGVSIDPGGVSNTKGAYSEITPSTTRPIRTLLVCFGHQNNALMADRDIAMDIAIGAAGSEQIIIADVRGQSDNDDNFVGPTMFPIYIPAGTRLACRAATNTTDATDRLFDIVLIGVG